MLEPVDHLLIVEGLQGVRYLGFEDVQVPGQQRQYGRYEHHRPSHDE